jgi:CheY-like chemotaxis protein
VTTVGSAAAALLALREGSFDVLVSDVGMPDEDGYSLIRKVRALPASQGGRVPAVALTAYASVTDRTRALMAGFHAHAVKPIEPQELIVVIANLVGRFSNR